MMLIEPGQRQCRWCSAFIVAVGGLAALVLWSWAAGVSDLLSFAPRQIPMAPGTALVFLLVAAILPILLLRPAFRLLRACSYSVAGLTAFSFLGIGGLLALPVFVLPVVLFGAPVSSGLTDAAWVGVVGFTPGSTPNSAAAV